MLARSCWSGCAKIKLRRDVNLAPNPRQILREESLAIGVMCARMRITGLCYEEDARSVVWWMAGDSEIAFALATMGLRDMMHGQE